MPVDIVGTEEVNIEATNLMAAGIFESPREAEAAFGLLQQSGFGAQFVSYLQRKGQVLNELDPNAQTGELVDPDVQPVAHDPLMGAVSGSAIGGATGWLVGFGLTLIPGVGPFLVAGTLATLLAGAAVGAVAGGLAGALLLWGAPNDIAHHYAKELEGSRCLLTVSSQRVERQELAASLLTRAGGQDVRTFVREAR